MRKASSGEEGAGVDAEEERALFTAGSSGRVEGKVGETRDLGPGVGAALGGDRGHAAHPSAGAGDERVHRLESELTTSRRGGSILPRGGGGRAPRDEESVLSGR